MSENLVLGGPYEKPKTPFKVGELRTKVWRAPFTHGLTDLWRERCREYWERVEQRFGIVVSERADDWYDDPELGPCVMTAATVLVILKGDRVLVPAGERLVH